MQTEQEKRLTPACVDFMHASRLLDIIVSLPRTNAKVRKALQTSYINKKKKNVFWGNLNVDTNIFILCKADGSTSGCCVLCRPGCSDEVQIAGYLGLIFRSVLLDLRNTEQCGLILCNYSLPPTSLHTLSPKLVRLKSHLFWIINKVSDLLFWYSDIYRRQYVFRCFSFCFPFLFTWSLFPSL